MNDRHATFAAAQAHADTLARRLPNTHTAVVTHDNRPPACWRVAVIPGRHTAPTRHLGLPVLYAAAPQPDEQAA